MQDRSSRNFWIAAVLAGIVVMLGLAASYLMETRGHGSTTGMGNAIVWGLPHVFAILMIVAASGVLNVASVGSVFGQGPYKQRARLSGLLSLALLWGGLIVLVRDIGRPDRLIVAATRYNFTSMFAWNVILYSGLSAIVLVYLWTMLQPGLDRWSKPVGIAAFVWRIVLTTGTGSLFGFIVARPSYHSALFAPLFVVFSFGWGLAVFILAQKLLYGRGGVPWSEEVRARMARLLGLFVAAGLYLVAALHIANAYEAKRHAFEAFLLLGQGGGAPYSEMFWIGYVALGSLAPLVLLLHPRLRSEGGVLTAAALVVIGAFAWLYAFIIGGQAIPLEIFPGYAAHSTFGDGAVAYYVPSAVEVLLGLGGVAVAVLVTLIGAHLFDMSPHDLA